MNRLHSAVLQEFPQREPIVPGWLHAGDYSSFAMFLCHILLPCLECLEPCLGIAEFQRLFGASVISPVECSSIMRLTSDINTNNQSFSAMDAIFAFCVLQFILDASLFNKIFTNWLKSVILFYSEVFFSQPSFLGFPILELYRKLPLRFPFLSAFAMPIPP